MNDILMAMAAAGLLLVAAGAWAEKNELAEDLGAATGSVIGAPGGPAASAAGALAGKYGSRAVNKGVSWAVDAHFDAEDQALSNRECITIQYADGKVIKPSADSNCP